MKHVNYYGVCEAQILGNGNLAVLNCTCKLLV